MKSLSEKKHKKRIAAMFLIATPFWGGPAGWQLDEFVLRDGFAATLPKIPRIFLYHSHDDDVVPFTHLALYTSALPQATVRELDGYGHLFKKKCRELVEDIKSL